MSKTPFVTTLATRLALILLSAGHASADTFASGTLAVDTTWTAANSPIRIDSTLTVPVGRTLRIGPGVELLMGAHATALTADRGAPQPAGTAVTLTAMATGGSAPYQYKWWLFDGTVWTTLTGWSTSSSLVWTPTAENPNNTIAVWTRNAGATVDAADSIAAKRTLPFATTAPVASGPLTVTALVASRVGALSSTALITFTASASGGTGPYQYKWWMWDGVVWTPVSEWSTNPTFQYAPTLAGAAYQVAVRARNATSTTDAADSRAAKGTLSYSAW